MVQHYLTTIVLVGGLLFMTAHTAHSQAKKPAAQPQVEVVFCLDTTGSMGGLIKAAKQKIWAISNQIAGGQPTPVLKIGLIAYRDRTDKYVTKVFDLTEDLDAIYNHLMKFQAQGGGDFPESVNQALNEAVTKVNWSKNKKTLKIIFLVGDAPPKTYANDVTYQNTCKLAVQNNIIINTVQCNTNAQTQTVWKDICRRAEGRYVQLDSKGGPVVVVKTPYDEGLTKINRELTHSTLTYGRGRFREEAEKKRDKALTLPAPTAASRAGFIGKSRRTAAYDLLDGIRAGKVKLEELKKAELPKELQKLTVSEQRTFLKKLDQKRTLLQRDAVELDKKRNLYIQQKLKEMSTDTRDSFDQQVLRILQTQAERADIRYTESPKKGQKK